MVNEVELKTFPTLQATMGDWRYYITTLPFYEVARRVQLATELVTPHNMNQWIQRSVIPRRSTQIADYLINQEQHFFPSIVVGVYQGEPNWYEIDVEENSIFGTPGLDPRFRYSLGILELDGSEKLYAIDGQHRVAGIKEALRRLEKSEDIEGYERLANESLSIVFVSADIDQTGQLERVRRLFTTLNKQAKRVSEPEIIALDEDDAAAIVTRKVAINYEGLSSPDGGSGRNNVGLIQMGTRHEILPSNRQSVTTIVSLYRMIKRVFQPDLKSLGRKYKGNRPDDSDLELMYRDTVEVWEAMRRYSPALNDVLGSDPREERAAIYRNEHGGHILFRPVGLQAFAGALGLLRTRGVDTERAVRSLCQLPMEISDIPWRHVVWNPNTSRMINGNKTMAEALFLYMLGQEPRTASYDVASKYRELHGDSLTDPFEKIGVGELD